MFLSLCLFAALVLMWWRLMEVSEKLHRVELQMGDFVSRDEYGIGCQVFSSRGEKLLQRVGDNFVLDLRSA
jgi:hypothetical protein